MSDTVDRDTTLDDYTAPDQAASEQAASDTAPMTPASAASDGVPMAPAQPAPEEAPAAGGSSTPRPPAVPGGRPAMPGRQAFSAFRIPGFRYLWLNSLSFALIGSTHRFAYVWLVLELDGGPAAAGLVTFAMGIPVLGVSIPAGVLSDRMDRRTLMTLSQLGATIVTVVTAVLVFAGMITVGITIALSLCVGAITAFGQPVRQASIPVVVGRERLMNAIVLMSFVMNISMIIGPAVGGAIIALWGLGGAFVAATIFYVVGMLFLIPLRIPNASSETGGRPTGGVREGFQFILKAPGMLSLFAMLALTGVFMMGPFSALLPELARTALGREAFEASLLFTALGAGMFIASIALATIGDIRRKGVVFVAALIPGGLIFSSIGLSRVYLLTAGLMVLWGIGGGIFMNLNQTLIQSNTPNEYMGRVMSVHTVFFMGLTPAGGLLAGWGASVIGAPLWIALSGVGMSAAAAFMLITQPALRRMG